ncbi:receptor-type tyrosine-protein phosphatase eta-like, partial [Arapaima gigas]
RSKGTNTSSVTLNWEQADAKDGYKYLVEVFNGTSPVQNHTVSTTSTTVANLQSGSLFTFNVTTQAAGGTPSAPTSVSVSTTPYSIQNLTVVTLNTTALYVNWGQPSEYQVGYKYTVNISGSTANEQSQSVDKEQAYWTELIPGTNYTVTVTTMTQKNVPGLPVSTSQYTKPEKVNLTISNGNTSNSIMLNWTAPLGNADQYLVSLTGPQQKNMSLNSTFTSYNFTNLTAGTVYNATVITISGPFEAVSQVVSTATYPNLPGAISITGKNTSSLSLTWEPAFPTGINFSYRVQYQSSTTNLTTVSSTTNSINLENLTSGTSYNISVATVGPMDFHSGPVWKNFITTRPNSVTNLRSKGTNTSSVTLNWEQADAKDGYKYLVEVFNGTSPVQNHTVSTTSTTVANLQSGSLFTFNVTTQAA